MNTKKIVLVTGATGFFGRNLIPKLIERGYEIHAIVRSNKHTLPLDKVNVHKVDLSNLERMRSILLRTNPSIIFHLGAYLAKGDSPKEIETTYRSNVLGTLSLLTAAQQIPYTHLIFAGTYIQYGNQTLPYRENQDQMPLSCYAASKTVAEHYCRLFASYGKPITMLRFGSAYGPFENPANFIPSVIRSAIVGKPIIVASSRKTRDFIYAVDAVDALLKAATSKKAIGHAINISSGKGTNLLAAAKIIARICKSKSPITSKNTPKRKNDPLHMRSDISSSSKLLGWKPKISLKDGLKKTIQWHKENT